MPPSGRELHGVVQQVVEDRLQAGPVHGDGERAGGDVQRELDAGLLGPGGRAVGQLPGYGDQVGRLALAGRLAGLEARELKEVVREARETRGLDERLVDEPALVVARRLALGQLQVGLQRGERRADLVRRVGDEPAQGRHRRLHTGGHAVEGLAEAPDLVASGDGRAGAEVAGGHPVARVRERHYRPRDAPGDQ